MQSDLDYGHIIENAESADIILKFFTNQIIWLKEEIRFPPHIYASILTLKLKDTFLNFFAG
jgi:hypothetical protein